MESDEEFAGEPADPLTPWKRLGLTLDARVVGACLSPRDRAMTVTPRGTDRVCELPLQAVDMDTFRAT